MEQFNEKWNAEDSEKKEKLPKSQIQLLIKKLFEDHKNGDDIVMSIITNKLNDPLADNFTREETLKMIDDALEEIQNE